MGLRHVASDPLKASMKALALPQEIMEDKSAIHKTLKKKNATRQITFLFSGI